MKLILLTLFFALPATTAALETSTLMQLSDGSAHITIENVDPENFEELKKMIDNPMIRSAIGERLFSLYCEEGFRNFTITVKSRSIVIDFECTVAIQTKNRWEINKIDWNKTDNRSLTIVLPENSKLVYAEPEPNEISGNALTWHNASFFLPHLVYEKKSSALILALVVGIACIIFVACIYKKKR